MSILLNNVKIPCILPLFVNFMDFSVSLNFRNVLTQMEMDFGHIFLESLYNNVNILGYFVWTKHEIAYDGLASLANENSVKDI